MLKALGRTCSGQGSCSLPEGASTEANENLGEGASQQHRNWGGDIGCIEYPS